MVETQELREALKAFLSGESTPEALEAWIVAAQDEIPAAELDAVWKLRLLLTEYGEQLRELGDAVQLAQALLEGQTTETGSSSTLQSEVVGPRPESARESSAA